MIIRLIFTVVAIFSSYAATAQSFEQILNSALKSAVSETQNTQSEAGRIPTTAEITGRWRYNAPIIKYVGDDPMTALAIGGINSKLAVYCAQAGLKSGDGHATLSKGSITLEIPKHKTIGKYNYHTNGHIELTFSDKGRKGTLHGYASIDKDEALIVMFDMQDALEAIHAITGKYSGNKNIDQLAEILKQYPGIEVGVKLNKR